MRNILGTVWKGMIDLFKGVKPSKRRLLLSGVLFVIVAVLTSGLGISAPDKRYEDSGSNIPQMTELPQQSKAQTLKYIKSEVATAGLLSLSNGVALTAQSNEYSEASEGYPVWGNTTVTLETWGYNYVLENGDIVQVGDNTTTDFKANVKTIRWNGLAEFSLGWSGGTFTPSLNGTTVSFNFNSDTTVNIYPVPSSTRLPEGGIEYDITINKKPAKPTVTLDIDWQGITWQKILPLNEEYDEATCIAEWGDTHSDFVLTQTNITGVNIETLQVDTLKHIEEYEVNSYLGTATAPTVKKTDYGEITDIESPHYGEHLMYGSVSRSHLYIHRGQMTDALNNTAWVEDINIDEQQKQITFDLPKEWLRTAEYPVSQVCGVDPAYTEAMDEIDGTGFTEVAWTAYDIEATDGYTSDMVLEFIITNDDAGKEYAAGVRTYGSSNDRKEPLHEAEGGGRTTMRLFVQPTDNAGSGNIEYYSQENTDVIFTVVGYWENVDFTETWTLETASGASSWVTQTLDAGTSLVHHILWLNNEADTANTLGVRDTSSALERKVLVHEQEGAGRSVLDSMVKSDASTQIKVYTDDTTNAFFRDTGYFGSEMDFVEDFQLVDCTNVGWNLKDISAELDQNGRVTDWLLLHDETEDPVTIGARDGDDVATNRYIYEHEAEDNGTITGELTGFGISAKSNSSGEVYLYIETFFTSNDNFYLMGYFKPAGGVADITNTPSSESLGVLSASSTYWAKTGAVAPDFPLGTGNCTFQLTNNSSGSVAISAKATTFIGTGNWTLTDGSPAANTVRLGLYKSSDNLTDNVTLTTTDRSFATGLAVNATLYWDFRLETGTFTEGSSKNSTITLTATLE